MANSVQLDYRGPDWPLGLIVVPTPGTPVSIMSLVDSANVNRPDTLNPPLTGAVPAKSQEYAVKFQQIIFQGFKGNAGSGFINNTGNVYVVRAGVGAGSGNKADFGSIVFCVLPGQTIILAAAPMVGDQYSPYRYSIDADNANDACLVTGIIGG